MKIVKVHKVDLEVAKRSLSESEAKISNSIGFELRRHQFILGRYAAKQALCELYKVEDLSTIEIGRGPNLEPLVLNLKGVGVTISHVADTAWAAAFPLSDPLGLDVEIIGRIEGRFLLHALSEKERAICTHHRLANFHPEVMLLSAKEALAKLTKTGFTVGFGVFSINSISINEDRRSQIHFASFPEARVIVEVSAGVLIAKASWNPLALANDNGKHLLTTVCP